MDTVAEKSLILDAAQIKQKIKRMAFEVFENNFKEKVVVIAGIEGQGYKLAQLLANEIESIATLKTFLIRVSIDKAIPQQSEIVLDCELKDIKKKCIIIVDDVLNTGRTFAYSLKPFLKIEVKKIEIAVLVNRSHTLFPIYPQYTGYELATTLSEHVEVVLGKENAVYLK
jgi:pyrimidine operon attenuation protein / uracil phosphoribosyltransferase